MFTPPSIDAMRTRFATWFAEARANTTRWDVASWAILALVVFGNVIFHVLDRRVPWDPGRYYTHLPTYYWDLGSPFTAIKSFFTSLPESTGWYEYLLAVYLRIVGRGPTAFAVVGLFWLTAVLVLARDIARRLGGPPAGLAAVALCAAIPSLTIFARYGWIHIPETALLLAAIALFVRDPGLTRRGTVIGMGVLGALTIELRESGLVWVATLVPLVVFGSRPAKGAPRPWRSILWIGAAWFLAFVPVLVRMTNYLSAKLGARGRYVLQTPPLSEQFGEAMTTQVSVLVAIGLVPFLLLMRRHWHPVLPLLAGWSFVPVLLFLVFYAGFTNYTPFMPALAIAGALGLVWVNRWLAFVPVLVFAYIYPPWFPLFAKQEQGGLEKDIRNMMRPWSGWGGAEVSALVDATCPENGWHSCHVVVEQGMFYPSSEEMGLLELFLLADDRVELRSVYDDPDTGWDGYRIDAAVVYYCGGWDDGWRRRAPESTERMLTRIRAAELSLGWYDRVDQRCSYYWFTRQGKFADPSRVPASRKADLAATWSADGLWQEVLDFQSRNPEFANKHGRASVYTPEVTLRAVAPPDWDQDTAARERVRAIRRFRASMQGGERQTEPR